MTLADFVAEVDASERSLVVLNRSEPEQMRSMLKGMFDDQPVGVDEVEVDDDRQDVVLLVGPDGEEVVAASPLSALEETILMVNSDLYVTGTRGIDREFPAVLTELDDVPFSLRGYPESNKEKLLLIVISRHIERIACTNDAGTLRTSFQRLSRIEDERGTRAVYERLADSDVDTHVYGIPDWVPPPEFSLTMHGGYGEEFRRSWFVVYTPDGTGDEGHAALVALETSPRQWEGFWTYRPDRVEAINAYIERSL